jgi:hypothetical protein
MNMNDIRIGDLVCERFRLQDSCLPSDAPTCSCCGNARLYKRLESWYFGIVVRVGDVSNCISYMNSEGRTLTNFAEKLTKLNDR